MTTVLQGCSRAARWWSGAVPLAFGFPLGRVAEWQTSWLQVPVSARTWGFKSPLAHQVVSPVQRPPRGYGRLQSDFDLPPKHPNGMQTSTSPLPIMRRRQTSHPELGAGTLALASARSE